VRRTAAVPGLHVRLTAAAPGLHARARSDSERGYGPAGPALHNVGVHLRFAVTGAFEGRPPRARSRGRPYEPPHQRLVPSADRRNDYRRSDGRNIRRLCAFRIKPVLCLAWMNNFATASDDRRTRLKRLVARLEQLPASPDRNRMLSEVRSRAVDLDTGVTPRAMLQVDAPILGPARPPSRRRSADGSHGTADRNSTLGVLERRKLREQSVASRWPGARNASSR
jgi:hypothetical protein